MTVGAGTKFTILEVLKFVIIAHVMYNILVLLQRTQTLAVRIRGDTQP